MRSERALSELKWASFYRVMSAPTEGRGTAGGQAVLPEHDLAALKSVAVAGLVAVIAGKPSPIPRTHIAWAVTDGAPSTRGERYRLDVQSCARTTAASGASQAAAT